MKPRLGIDDVLLLVGISALIHWARSAEWTMGGFLERAGFVVPAALICVATWRAWREHVNG